MSRAAPLRFLAAVVGGWVAFRLLVLMPLGPEAAAVPTAQHVAAPAPAPPLRVPPVRAPALAAAAAPEALAGRFRARWVPGLQRAASSPPPTARSWPPLLQRSAVPVASAAPAQLLAGLVAVPPTAPAGAASPPAPAIIRAAATPILPPPVRAASAPGRWSGAAWLFLRDGSGTGGLAPGGTLGGSQAGARLRYRINGDARRPLAISARLYAPVDRPEGAEAALGLDWRPLADVPLHILAERRQAIGREGRSDFALTVYGGGEQRLLRGRLKVEAYGQAGLVGAREHDLFADGAVRASVPIGRLELGAGAWGGAQPRAARLDVGPQASIRLPVAGTALRASAEWRFRIAGDAAPGSGPAFTLAADF